MSNPWDVPPLPDTGDPHAHSIFAAVGRAMTQWEHVEAALGDLFAFLVGGYFGITEPAVRAYGSVPSFNARAGMLEEAAAAYFHANPNPEFSERFRQVVTVQCRGFSGRRNDIAHGRVQHAFNSNGVGASNFLMPSLHASKKHGLDQMPKYIYATKEIDYFTGQFSLLYEKIAALVNDMHRAS